LDAAAAAGVPAGAAGDVGGLLELLELEGADFEASGGPDFVLLPGGAALFCAGGADDGDSLGVVDALPPDSGAVPVAGGEDVAPDADAAGADGVAVGADGVGAACSPDADSGAGGGELDEGEPR
jgi:hypothetical protein